MSSSEPRLPVGEGPPELRAVSVMPLPKAENNPSSEMEAVINKKSASPVSVSTNSLSPASPKTATDDHDALPPLISLSDLMVEAPAWLLSAALHMFVIIVLALIFIVPDRPVELLLRLDDQDGFEELDGVDFDLDLDVAEETVDSSLEAQELVALEEPELVDPADILPPVLNTEALEVSTPIQMALTGRTEGLQQKLLDAYGGTAATQRSVMMALRWLERNQSSQGMWSLRGKYSDGSGRENREAATGMALLAFQGAGYTPNGDPQHDFTKVTSRAWKQLLRKQNESGDFIQPGINSHSQLYTQAICTIALCELYGMTKDSRYQEPAQRAIDYCVRIQAKEGGWRYFPGTDSDLSATGWFVMAMQSARMAGLEVPTPTLKRISGYLDSVSALDGAAYCYRPESGHTASMTAEGLLCRQYLGWSQSDPRLRKGAKSLIENLPDWDSDDRDVYYWYYATQVCHHMEGHFWRTWNNAMKVELPENQVQSGPERGSWNPKGDEWGNQGGRLYVTCLSTFMLEVYYRHLPIYRKDIANGGL